MNFDDYKVKTPCPSLDDYKVEEVVTRNGKIVSKKLVFDRDAYKDAIKEYRKKQQELITKFQNDLFEELGIYNHPKREKLYDLAWVYGKSEGLSSVFDYAAELVDLIQ